MKIFLTLAVLLTTALASGQEPLPEPLPKPLPKQVPPTQDLTQEPTHIQAPDRPPDQNHDWTSRTVTYEPQDIVTIPTQNPLHDHRRPPGDGDHRGLRGGRQVVLGRRGHRELRLHQAEQSGREHERDAHHRYRKALLPRRPRGERA